MYDAEKANHATHKVSREVTEDGEKKRVLNAREEKEV